MTDTTEVGAETIEARNPATGELLGTVPTMDEAEVRQLVQFARRTQAEWGALPVRERCRHLGRVQDVLAARTREVTTRVAAMTGKPRAEAVMTEVHAVCELIHTMRRIAPDVLAPERVGVGVVKHKRAWKTYEPYGVIGAISPWNVPFTLSMAPIVSALLAGNTVVLKPSRVTPLVGELIADLMRDGGVPEHAVCVATGGSTTGDALVRSGVDKIHFTGSTATGKKIMAAAAETLTPVTMELGGKDPMIVCEDADIERAAAGAVWGAFTNLGQACVAIERVFAVDSVHDEFVARLVENVRRLRQGPDTGRPVDVGSMITHEQLEIVIDHVEDAVERGATVCCGGRLRPDLTGDFFEPTVLTGANPSMKVMREETFGPVLPVMRVSDVDEAIQLANDSVYGLTASVWTTSCTRGIEIASQIQAGNVSVNDHTLNYGITELPFGGVKASGFGRVHGREGLLEFVQTKSWTTDRGWIRKEFYWFPFRDDTLELGARLTGLLYRKSLLGKLKSLAGR